MDHGSPPIIAENSRACHGVFSPLPIYSSLPTTPVNQMGLRRQNPRLVNGLEHPVHPLMAE